MQKRGILAEKQVPHKRRHVSHGKRHLQKKQAPRGFLVENQVPRKNNKLLALVKPKGCEATSWRTHILETFLVNPHPHEATARETILTKSEACGTTSHFLTKPHLCETVQDSRKTSKKPRKTIKHSCENDVSNIEPHSSRPSSTSRS